MNRHLLAMLATGTCIVAIAAPAQAQATTFEIPAGSLSKALDTFARQSGRQVVYRADDIKAARSSGVRGAMSPEAALQVILDGTGFGVRSDSSGAVAIVRVGNGRVRANAVLEQNTPTPTMTAAAAPEPAPSDVIVTGSRISRRDFQSDSPISTITSAQIASSGQPSLDRAIGQMPQFAAAQGASEVGDVQGGLGFSGGQSYSDLRGLGPNRSLVLLDGRRVMPSSPEGSIDLNTIPTPMIESVEVITGGASATYGSDAVAGVVNFKLKHNFSGIELSAQHGATTKGDGATNQFSGIVGGNFNDGRGNAVLAFEYSNRALIEGSTRPFFANIRQLARPPEGILAAGNYGGGAPTVAAVNAVLAGYPGTTPIAATANGLYTGAIGLNTDGSIFTTAAGANCAQNYKGLSSGIKGVNISPNCTTAEVALGQYFGVQVPLTKYNIFARTTYELTDHVTAYAQFNYMESTAIDQTGPGSSKAALPLIVPQNNPFVTGNAALQSILNSITPTPTGNIIVTKLLSAFGNRVETFKYDVWQAVVGFKGSVPGTKINYDIYGSLGHSQFINNNFGDVSRAAITSVLNGTANYTGNAGNCRGYAWNPLGNNALSPGCLEYTRRDDHSINTMTQKVVEGTLEGPIFKLPAGDLRFAVGGDYREVSFDFRPDSTLVTNDSLSYGSITPAAGRQTVYEAFGELLVPILADKPFFKELSLDLGYRYSHYNQSGSNSTWKIDGTWAPADVIRFRGSYSRAIRAPSLANLYGPTSVGQLNIGTPPSAGDPCAVGSVFRTGANASQVQSLCIAQGVPTALYPTYTYGVASVAGQDGSNVNLTPEKATTYSFGTVITPRFSGALFHSFNFSVDYYKIKIKGAIGSLLLTDILPRCFNSDGASNPGYSVSNAYCSRITRDPSTGVILLGQQGLFNFATYTVAGIDTQINWKFGLDALGMSPSAGSLQFDTVVAYLSTYKVAGLLGSPTLNYAGSAGFGGVGGGISHPKWKANTSLTYANGAFSITGRWRYIGAMVHSDKVANAAAVTPGVPAYSYFDANVQYTINQRFTLGAGLTNLTDKAPPFISAAPLTTDAATYDVVGRTWFVSAKVKF